MDQFSPNPFVYKPIYTRKDYLNFTLMIPIALIRSIIIFITTIFFILSAYFFYTIKQIHRPVNYHEVKKYYIAIPMFFMKLICLAFGLNVSLIEHPNNKKKNVKSNLYIFAPHSSVFDIPVIWLLNVTTAVASEEIKNMWLLSNPILVVRDNPASRQETIKQIKLRSRYEKIAIFPEGTCTNRSSIIKFRLGAFVPGVPIQPVYIDYAEDANSNTIWTFEGPSLLKIFFLTLFKWRTSIKARLLPVYSPLREEIEEPWQYGINVQNYFCEYFNLRRSLYSFEDPKFLSITKSKGIPRSPCCIKLIKICYKIITIINEEKQNNKKNNQSLNNDENQITETSSVRMIALKNKKSSIGSINSMIDYGFNWMDELDTFLKNFIFYSLDKLNSLDNLNLPITSTQDLIDFLELDKKYPSIENSSRTFEDFYTTVSGLSNKSKMTYLDLYIILTLCNTSVFCIKDRIDSCIMKMENIRKSQLTDHIIGYSNFCKLIWHLIGIDEIYMPETIFKQKKITSEFFKKEIIDTFNLAVLQNVPDMISIN